MSPNPYYLMVSFWGERFREYFYSLCLSSLLSPNNIPALRDVPGCKFIIATSKCDWEELQGRPLFEQLREYMEPVFVDIGYPLDGDQKMLHMSKGHRLAARKAIEAGAWAGFVAPDLLVSDGAVPFVMDKARRGKKAVLVPAIRYAMEPVMAALGARGLLEPDRPICLEPRSMAELAQESLHSEIRRYEYDAPYYGDYPIWSYWRVPGRKGIVMHTASWALLLGNFADMREYTDSSLEHGTIDGNYVYQNFFRSNRKTDLCLASDSDELVFMSLTPEAELTYLPFEDQPLNRMAGGEFNRMYHMRRFLFGSEVDPFRRWAYEVPCQIHGDDLTLGSTETATKSAAKISQAMGPWLGMIGRGLKMRNSAVGIVRELQTTKGRIVLRGAERRMLRMVFGWMVGPVLGGLNHRRLVLALKLVPKRYHRGVMRRVSSSRKNRARMAEGQQSVLR